MISIQCRSCGKKLVAPPEFAGKRVKCRGCGSILQIPAPRSGRAPSDTPRRPRKPPAAPARAARAARRRRRPKPQADQGLDGDLDLASLVRYERSARQVRDPQKRPCRACDGMVRKDEDECPWCGVRLRPRAEAGSVPSDGTSRILSDAERETYLRERSMSADGGSGGFFDSIDADTWKIIIFVLIFFVGNAILLTTTGYIVVPR